MMGMVRRLRAAVATGATAALAAGCALYPARVVTDLDAGPTVHRTRWAHGWAFGLIGPEVDMTGTCRNGVAAVETRLSFLNLAAGVLTAGVYTPMTVEVRCSVRPRVDAAGS
ncbi:MAG TPA: hypothetical protein VF188_06355 [Longimicrobiales bacterium]